MSEAPRRVVVPGLIDVEVLEDGTGLLHTGPLADIPEAEPGTVPITLVPGPPDLDVPDHPHVAARLARLRWHVGRRGGGASLTVGPGLSLRWEPADGPAREVRLEAAALIEAWPAAWPGEDLPERRLDRVCRALTDGAVSLRDVALAEWAAALDPVLLDHEEALIAEVHGRGEADRAVGEAIVEALGGDEPVEVPVLGEGVPVALTPVEVGGVALPSETRWRTGAVEDWEPEAAAAYRRARLARLQGRLQDARAEGRRRERRVWIAIGVLLALGLAVGVLGWLAQG